MYPLPAPTFRRRSLNALTVGLTLTAAFGTASLGAITDAASAVDTPTLSRYTFDAGSYGTSITSRLAGLRSAPSSSSGVGCTKVVPRTSSNSASTADQNPQVRTGHVQTTNTTFRDAKNNTGARSRSVIDSVLLRGSDIELSITGLRGTSTTYATPTDGFKAFSTLTFSALSPTGAGADLLSPELRELLDGPANEVIEQLKARQPIEIPGLGVLRIGTETRTLTGSSARATQDALEVELYGLDGVRGGLDDSIVTVGHTSSRTSSASPNGVLSGSSHGIDATAADGSVTVGPQVVMSLACEGTAGAVRTAAAAQLDQPRLNGLSVGGLQNRVSGDQTSDGVTGWTESRIADLDFGGDLHVDGIVARSTITKLEGGSLRRSVLHRIGSIQSHGKAYAVPAPGQALVIPGVARIEVPRAVSTTRGVSVTGLRITLLSGSAAQSVINLAVTRASVPE